MGNDSKKVKTPQDSELSIDFSKEAYDSQIGLCQFLSQLAQVCLCML